MANPSRANWDGDYPRVCCICGKKLTITGTPALCFYTDAAGRPYSYHFDCRGQFKEHLQSPS